MSVLVRPECKVARVVRRPPDSEARKSDYLRTRHHEGEPRVINLSNGNTNSAPPFCRASVWEKWSLRTESGMGRSRTFRLCTNARACSRERSRFAKRHRDVFFVDRDASLAPNSFALTTLTGRSYEDCVRSFEFDAPFDLHLDDVAKMPDFIDNAPSA
jgi:hypothetical protein